MFRDPDTPRDGMDCDDFVDDDDDHEECDSEAAEGEGLFQERHVGLRLASGFPSDHEVEVNGDSFLHHLSSFLRSPGPCASEPVDENDSEAGHPEVEDSTVGPFAYVFASESDRRDNDHPRSDLIRQAEEGEPDGAAAAAVVLDNFGMPLPSDQPQHRIDRRYLLLCDNQAAPLLFISILVHLFLHSHLAIRSPMDTGKSHAYITYLRSLLALHPSLRVLLITSRITLAYQLKERLKSEGMRCVSYLDPEVKRDPSCFLDASCVIIQLDSLPRLASFPVPFDIVLLDESESTLKHFSAATLAEREKVWERFQFFCSRCAQLILLDAHLGARSAWWLQEMFGEAANANHDDDQSSIDEANLSHDNRELRARLGQPRLRVFVNDRKTDEKTYVNHPTKESFTFAMRSLLQMNKKLAIACNSKRKAKHFHRCIDKWFPKLKVSLYCSDSGAAEKEEVARCNEEWIGYDVVIYSPTVGAGVDFNPVQPHFDAIFAFGVSTSNPCSEFMQMIGRVRKVKDKVVHVYLQDLSPTRYTFHCNREYIHSELEKSNEMLNIPATVNDPRYRQLYIYNRVEAEQSKSMFSALFWKGVEEKGGRKEFASVPYTDQERQALKDDIDAMEEEQKQEECELLVDEKFTSSYAVQESRERLKSSRATARDNRLRQQQDLIDQYGLSRVSACSGYASLKQREVMLTFVQTLGQKKSIEQFRTFCRLNSSLPHWFQDWQRWMMAENKYKDRPEERAERRAYWRALLTKGVMYIAGFLSRRDHSPSSCNHQQRIAQLSIPSLAGSVPIDSEAAAAAAGAAADRYVANESRVAIGPIGVASSTMTSSSSSTATGPKKGRKRRHDSVDDIDALPLRPPTVNEEAGNICSTESTDTAKIEHRLTHEGGNEWLRENWKWIKGELGNEMDEREFYAPAVVIRLANTMLKKAGLKLERFKQRRPRSRTERKRKAITFWRISPQSIAISSMLELAYAIRRGGYLTASHQDLGDWDVQTTLLQWRPAFQWQELTGVQQPYPCSPLQPSSNDVDVAYCDSQPGTAAAAAINSDSEAAAAHPSSSVIPAAASASLGAPDVATTTDANS